MVQQGSSRYCGLTDGDQHLSAGPEVRLVEAQEAARVLGVHVREILPLPNRRLFDNFESRVALAAVFRRYRPKVVLGMPIARRWRRPITGSDADH